MIELKQLCAGYTSEEVLHGITASLGHGMLVSIVGPNGCGKSTLLKTVAGILRAQNGEVLLDGISASAMRRDALAAHIAYLAQGKQAPAMTVGEMVLHGRFPHLHFPRRYSARDREIAGTAMEALGIMQYADTPVAALSGGMRQSAYLAMALTQEADYILLDEPTTYLDIANQISLMRLLYKLSRDGHGIAAVMHDLPLSLAYSDEIWVMRDGILVMTASPQEIVSSGVLHEVFGVDVRADSGQYSYHFV